MDFWNVILLNYYWKCSFCLWSVLVLTPKLIIFSSLKSMKSFGISHFPSTSDVVGNNLRLLTFSLEINSSSRLEIDIQLDICFDRSLAYCDVFGRCFLSKPKILRTTFYNLWKISGSVKLFCRWSCWFLRHNKHNIHYKK